MIGNSTSIQGSGGSMLGGDSVLDRVDFTLGSINFMLGSIDFALGSISPIPGRGYYLYPVLSVNKPSISGSDSEPLTLSSQSSKLYME